MRTLIAVCSPRARSPRGPSPARSDDAPRAHGSPCAPTTANRPRRSAPTTTRDGDGRGDLLRVLPCQLPKARQAAAASTPPTTHDPPKRTLGLRQSPSGVQADLLLKTKYSEKFSARRAGDQDRLASVLVLKRGERTRAASG